MAQPIIFPQPQQMTVSSRRMKLGDGGRPCPVAVRPGVSDGVRDAAHRLADLLGTSVVDEQYNGQTVRLLPLPADDIAFGRTGGYGVEAVGNELHVLYADEAGAHYAVQTMRALIEQYGFDALPVVTVRDWPELPYRGLYIESIWGSDRMRLDDFKQVIDLMSNLKMNVLVFGLYGCWERKHGYEPAEFMFAQLACAPDLVTPQSVRYLDPDTKSWKREQYVPVIAEQDLPATIFRYATEKRIEVIPVFNGPAHNTFIPRVRPEISAIGPDGKPTTYGYCISNPSTFVFLGACYEEIYERYLKPNGISSFDIGCDEVYPIMNVAADDPRRVVDPTCYCNKCRLLTREEQLLRYIEGAGERLVALGIDRILVYGDSLARMGLLNESFVERFETNGLLDHLVLGMWAYREPLLLLYKELGLRVFAMPSTGYGQILFHQDFTDNIYRTVQHALRADADGTFAYSLWDPAQHRNVTFLADVSWNGQMTVPEFSLRYARKHFGEHWRQAVEAQTLLERVFGSYPLMIGLLDHLLAYFNQYPYGNVQYPADVLSIVADDPLSLRAVMRNAADQVDVARQLLGDIHYEVGREGIDWSHEMQLQCLRFSETLNAVLAIVDGLLAYMRAQERQHSDADGARNELEQAGRRVTASTGAYLHMMGRLKSERPHFVVPSELREQSEIANALLRLGSELDEALAAMAAGASIPQSRLAEEVGVVNKRELWHPWLF